MIEREDIEFSSTNLDHIIKIIEQLKTEHDYHSHTFCFRDGFFWANVYLKTNEELYGDL